MKAQLDDASEVDIAFTAANLLYVLTSIITVVTSWETNSGGGVETTAFTLHFLVLAMLLHPDMQKRAQQAVDAALGDQPPTFADRTKLAYVDAMVKEALRWRPVAPNGMCFFFLIRA